MNNIKYPYNITIKNKYDAMDIVLNMCNDCPKQEICTQSMQKKCVDVKNKLTHEYNLTNARHICASTI